MQLCEICDFVLYPASSSGIHVHVPHMWKLSTVGGGEGSWGVGEG